MAHKRKTQPAALPELDKPAPFVPKVKDIENPHLPAHTGRPSKYDPAVTPKMVRGMAKQGLSEACMARILEISPSTFSLWKTQHSAFSKALEYGREACDGALEATAVQRALGYSYETEKAFQTGVRMTVTETMPPEPNMLKFLLERRMPDKYREIKEVQHTHNAGALFQQFLKRMDEAKKIEEQKAPKMVDITPGPPHYGEPQLSEPVSPPLAHEPEQAAKPLIDKDNADGITS